MATSPPPSHDALQAVAAAVRAAVTHDGRGRDPVAEVTDEASLRTFVESHLDGYEVTPVSLSAAVQEGAALTEATLKELISQSSAAGIDLEEFFADGEFDLEAGLAAAAGGPAAGSVRERILSVWQAAEDVGECILVRPEETWSSRGAHEIAHARILERGLPASTPYFGWGGDRDMLRPDGTMKKGEDHQEVFWRGDAEAIRALLRRVEPLGYVIEGGARGTRFRVVPAEDASSPEPYALPPREDLLTDPGSLGMGALRYATTWVERSHRSKRQEDLLTEDEARAAYEPADAGERRDVVVFPAVPDGEIPAWSITVRGRSKDVVVTHYHRRSGSAARIVELSYSPIHTDNVFRGSLRRARVTDYLWPDGHATYAPKSRAPLMISLRDGKGAPEILYEDRVTGEKTLAKHRDGSAGRKAVPRPEFGAWEAILDPSFGEPEDPAVVPRLLIDDRWDEAGDAIWDESSR